MPMNDMTVKDEGRTDLTARAYTPEVPGDTGDTLESSPTLIGDGMEVNRDVPHIRTPGERLICGSDAPSQLAGSVATGW